MSIRPTLAVSVAVFRNGEVLLAQRARAPGQGLWSLPGGRVEPGETLHQAVLRELDEEVGVAARIIGFNDHVEVIRRDAAGKVEAHFVIASFIGRWLSGEPRPGPEAAAVAWVDPLDLGGRPTTPGLDAVLARAAWLAASAGET